MSTEEAGKVFKNISSLINFYQNVQKRIYLLVQKNRKNKRNTELHWKQLPALIVLPTHLEYIFTVSIALQSCACFLSNFFLSGRANSIHYASTQNNYLRICRICVCVCVCVCVHCYYSHIRVNQGTLSPRT